MRVLFVEILPVAGIPERQQPVVAHAVGNGAAVVARQECENFIGLGVSQARAQAVIIDIGGDGVGLQAIGQDIGLVFVTAARRVAQCQKGIVIAEWIGRRFLCPRLWRQNQRRTQGRDDRPYLLAAHDATPINYP